jgi:sulfite reductase alpha subunit-like flavoprotein
VDCEADYPTHAGRWLDTVVSVLGGRPASTTASPSPSAVPAAPPRATARLAGNRLLSQPGSAKEVREFTIDLGDTGPQYQTGDAIAVTPENCPELVDEWLAVTGLDADQPVRLAGTGDVRFREALRRHLEIAVPGMPLLRLVTERGGDRSLRRMLHAVDRVEFHKWLWGRQTVDVIAESGVRATAQEWVNVLGPLRPRRYSISSSPLTDPRRVRIMVSVVRYEGVHGRLRKGTCSGYLADAAEGTQLAVAIHRSAHFRPPEDPDRPAIMIGPGTGLAPFLGFLDDRAARGHTGPNWLFFGEQHRATDFYYRHELRALRERGPLTRLDVAFSRDQRAKVYVQDRMSEHGSQLWSWLEHGAHVYVCGDAARMAKDVDRALRDIIARHGGMTATAAAARVRQLAADNRYVRDVY